MIDQITQRSVQIGDRNLTIEVGRFAQRSNAAVIARYGDTEVLATVVSAHPREDLDYFPLNVEYKEKYYAGGRISPSRFIKRERRPSDDNILSARLIDRSIRPLFPKDYRNEVQVVTTVLSFDEENNPDVVAAVAVSAVLAISNIPWNGPIGCVRVSLDDGKFLINPLLEKLEKSPLKLVVSSGSGLVVMIEAEAKQISEGDLVKAIEVGRQQNQLVIETINDLVKEVGRPKTPLVVSEFSAQAKEAVSKYSDQKVDEAIAAEIEFDQEGGLAKMAEEIYQNLGESVSKSQISKLVEARIKKRIRKVILEGRRPDGRAVDEIRPIKLEVGLLPRPHGSAVFQRGETQVLTVVSLGAPSLEQWIEGMMGEETKRYMHHYYAPPYSYGEVGRIGFPSRREVGHGALAERALAGVIPDEEKFPYTIRVVSEVMSSNGSTSMASVSGSTLALMDAGVPIEAPAAGISIGLVKEGTQEVILTDIIGLEDFNGDMDFKVAGTSRGITAIQLDVKIPGLSLELIKLILDRAKTNRLTILEKMAAVIKEPRPTVSQYAPKIHVVYIKPEMIGELIGPGGRVIRDIIAKTGASVDVNDEGRVVVAGQTQAEVDSARRWIEEITLTVEPGDHFTGTVERVEPYGVFVRIGTHKDGLVHVSEMSADYVGDPAEVAKISDEVEVWVKGLNERGQISLTMVDPSQMPARPRRFPNKQFDRSNKPGAMRGPGRPDRERTHYRPRDHYREALDSQKR